MIKNAIVTNLNFMGRNYIAESGKEKPFLNIDQLFNINHKTSLAMTNTQIQLI